MRHRCRFLRQRGPEKGRRCPPPPAPPPFFSPSPALQPAALALFPPVAPQKGAAPQLRTPVLPLPAPSAPLSSPTSPPGAEHPTLLAPAICAQAFSYPCVGPSPVPWGLELTPIAAQRARCMRDYIRTPLPGP